MIEDYIKNNLKNASFDEMESTIEKAIKENKEETLPGLGVLFKMYYQSLSREMKDSFINDLTELM